MKMRIAGLALCLLSTPVFAQSVISFDVVFDRVLEASGSFAPNLAPVATVGPFRSSAFGPLPPVTVTGKVTLSTVPSSNQLAGPANGFPLAVNAITLNGDFTNESGNSPPSTWYSYTFNNATFDLYGSGGGYMATDFVSNPNPNDWRMFTGTGLNGKLSDHGPSSIYGGTCPFFFGCQSLNAAGSGNGTTAVGWNNPAQLWKEGTPIYNKSINQPIFGAGFRNTGNHALVSGSVIEDSASGVGFANGMDAFALEGVLDTTNTQGNGTSQLYPDGVNGYPGKVRIVTFSNSGNSAFVLEGHVVYAAVPVPAAVWLFGSALGMLGFARRRRAA
jgi:hypothetical protein